MRFIKKMDDLNPIPVAVINIGVPNVDEQPKSPPEWVDIDPPDETLEEEVVLIASGSDTDPEVCLVKSEGTCRKAILWPALEKREGKQTIYPFLDHKNCDHDSSCVLCLPWNRFSCQAMAARTRFGKKYVQPCADFEPRTMNCFSLMGSAMSTPFVAVSVP